MDWLRPEILRQVIKLHNVVRNTCEEVRVGGGTYLTLERENLRSGQQGDLSAYWKSLFYVTVRVFEMSGKEVGCEGVRESQGQVQIGQR